MSSRESRGGVGGTRQQKLNLVLCGSDKTLKNSVSKLIREKNDLELHGCMIHLVELPALIQLSEEEVMRQTLRCVSLSDPGVHVFLLIIPDPLNNEDKAEMEEIQRIFSSRINKHIMILIMQNSEHQTAELHEETKTVIERSGGRHHFLGPNTQVSTLMENIERMLEENRGEFFSTETFLEAQMKKLMKYEEMKKKMNSLETPLQSQGSRKNTDELRIVLLGKTGVGKSATANTILGRNAFTAETSLESVTKESQRETSDINGRHVTVIDTPGLFDTELTNEEIQREIRHCISMILPGPHVFIIVLNLGQRFTREEATSVKIIQETFGEKSLMFTMVLFTRGDFLKNKTIEQCFGKPGSPLMNLIEACGNRYHVFNNNQTGDRTQVSDLLEKIDALVKANGEIFYSCKMFREMERERQEHQMKILMDRVRETEEEMNKLEEEKERMRKMMDEERQNQDKERKRREEDLKREIREQEKHQKEIRDEMRRERETFKHEMEEMRQEKEKIKTEKDQFQKEIERLMKITDNERKNHENEREELMKKHEEEKERMRMMMKEEQQNHDEERKRREEELKREIREQEKHQREIRDEMRRERETFKHEIEEMRKEKENVKKEKENLQIRNDTETDRMMKTIENERKNHETERKRREEEFNARVELYKTLIKEREENESKMLEQMRLQLEKQKQDLTQKREEEKKKEEREKLKSEHKKQSPVTDHTEMSKIQRIPIVIKDTPVSSLSARRIILLGKSGVGKSAAGNTILGQKEFRCERSMRLVTRECSVKHGTVSGRSVSVVDTPGIIDPHMKPKELISEIARSVHLCSPGPHAFIIVLRVDDRFTEHEQQIPQMIEMIFGEVLKYFFILFTHGDLLDGESVEKLIEENSRLRDVVGQYGGRFHVFNNRDENNRDQVNDLLQKIDTMIEQNGGEHCSDEMLAMAETGYHFRQSCVSS